MRRMDPVQLKTNRELMKWRGREEGREEGTQETNARLAEEELRSCVKVEVAVRGSPSLLVLMVSVDVKQH